MVEESRGTVLLAGGANLAIAIAKIIGGLVSGSTALLAEAAHSVADTVNQVFLLTALQRSKRPADELHPFGYGMERYFWALLAAVGIFVLGAGFSVYEGIRAIIHPEEVTGLVVAYGVLAVSFVFEGASWLRAVRQLRREAGERSRSIFEHLRTTSDPTAKTVAFEDTAALIGIGLAAAGVTLHVVTGQDFWDGAASVAIGVLLVAVAYALGRDNKSLLIGQAVSPQATSGIRAVIAAAPGVERPVDVLTMRLSPDEVLVAARVDLDNNLSGGDIEQQADEIERRIRERYPQVRHVFIDPTPGDAPKPDASLPDG